MLGLVRQTRCYRPAPVIVTKQFFVQVGAFSARDNALSLQSKLAGITPMPIEISEATTPNTIHKVQVGPFSDAASAENARSYLAQLSSGNLIIVKR